MMIFHSYVELPEGTVSIYRSGRVMYACIHIHIYHMCMYRLVIIAIIIMMTMITVIFICLSILDTYTIYIHILTYVYSRIVRPLGHQPDPANLLRWGPVNYCRWCVWLYIRVLCSIMMYDYMYVYVYAWFYVIICVYIPGNVNLRMSFLDNQTI